jgi:hypothetical protein
MELIPGQKVAGMFPAPNHLLIPQERALNQCPLDSVANVAD